MTPQDRQELIADIIAALKDAEPKLCPEELRWVKNAIKRQEESLAFRKAVIEKSFTGVVWLLILGVGTVFYEYAKNHGYRP
ncbi:MAG: hypothetical protein WBI20_14765 [Burkholderiaceae bacterium]